MATLMSKTFRELGVREQNNLPLSDTEKLVLRFYHGDSTLTFGEKARVDRWFNERMQERRKSTRKNETVDL